LFRRTTPWEALRRGAGNCLSEANPNPILSTALYDVDRRAITTFGPFSVVPYGDNFFTLFSVVPYGDSFLLFCRLIEFSVVLGERRLVVPLFSVVPNGERRLVFSVEFISGIRDAM